MPAVIVSDVPRQIGRSSKDRRVYLRLRFSQGPAFHYEEHLGALDRHFGDVTLVDDYVLIPR